MHGSRDKEGEETVEIAGLSFRTKEDFGAWVKVNAPEIPFGSVVDYHGLMQQVYYNMGEYDSLETLLDDRGYVSSQAAVNEAFKSCLEAVMEDAPELFPPDQKVSDYDVDLSLRRGSDSRAKALGVSLDNINGIHRWEKVERAQGRKPAQSMSDRYADVEYLRRCLSITLKASEKEETGIGVPLLSPCMPRGLGQKAHEGGWHPRGNVPSKQTACSQGNEILADGLHGTSGLVEYQEPLYNRRR